MYIYIYIYILYEYIIWDNNIIKKDDINKEKMKLFIIKMINIIIDIKFSRFIRSINESN